MKNKFVCDREGINLTEFLSDNIEFVSKPSINKQLKAGEVRVNKIKVKENAVLKKGDTVEIFLPAFMEPEQKVDIIFEDENILIADKPVLCDVENHLTKLLSKERAFVKPAHRLDRNTVGLVVFALNERSLASLKNAFKNRTVEKVYYALVDGVPKHEKAILTAYLKKDEEKKICYVCDKPQKDYEKIITGYEVVESYNSFSKVKIDLITGKTHQIRAHMAFIGHPVLGDNKYADKETLKKYNYKYQQLTAYSIKFQKLDEPLKYLENKTFCRKNIF